MLSKFFLDRPVFAWVIAIIIMASGALAIYKLPVSQYPLIAPPSIYIMAYYPGASAETVENSVTQIIEQKLTGLDRMLYMYATSDSSGTSRIEITFEPGVDPDLAWAKVQNKLQLAMASLPDVVQQMGLRVGKATRNYLLIANLISEDGSMDGSDLRDYAQSYLEKVLSRVEGVGEVEMFGTQYAMRLWLDPHKLLSYGMTIEDVIKAVKSYNVEVSAGQIGGAPQIKGQKLNVSIIVESLRKTPEEFASIPLKIGRDGSVIRVKDVGRVELGTEQYDIENFYNGMPSAGIAIRPVPGANALDTAEKIKKKLEEMKRYFPPGMNVVYPFDTTPFTKVAIREVIKTLFEAIILVFLVMWLFLGSLRITFIPTITVPVVLLGTFAVLKLFGYSINMLTMFAMVLAIGLLVDDAIVVVENVERIMREEGLPPREATEKSMDQITSALIGIGLVLSAVFGPMAFFGGSTGVIYRQFSVTIISSMLLSVLVALILTPVLCVTFMRKRETTSSISKTFFLKLDRAFFNLRDRYVRQVEKSFFRVTRYLIVYIIVVVGSLYFFSKLPTAYIPDEDQGILMAQVILPQGSTLEQTKSVLNEIYRYFRDNEKDSVESCMYVAGIGFSGRTQANGMVFIKLKDWHLRNRKEQKVDQIAKRAMMAFSSYKKALVFVFPPPSIVELGRSKGFDFQLLDRGGVGHEVLMSAKNELLRMANNDKRLYAVRYNGLEDVPQLRIEIDWEKAGALDVPITSAYNVISASFGGIYINDFIHQGRVKRVYAQLDAPYRMLPEDLNNVYVRNFEGKMVPFSSLATIKWVYGSPRLERYNGFPSINILGEAAPGRSSGEAMAAMEEIVSRLPSGIGYEWTGVSYQERLATGQAPILYAFSIFVIFLCVAALYESWAIPIANLLMLPLGVFGATLATYLRGLHNDVYFQIGFLTTLGLSTKNAILIIQFAKERLKKGENLLSATKSAAKIRLRPVIMTSFAFFFGVLPLALATGAGAGAMKAIGTAVCGGMLSATFIDMFYIPLFFVLVSKVFAVKGIKENT
ncbi:MAG: efflux RND transporter permease subunit [Deltaproteobacteria bacterium]|nr:efflux RND transporter permease subunit [Deltaproteobacteria bacterium]